MDLLGNLIKSAFGGAYYRKVTSAERSIYSGLRGEGSLPFITFDQTGKRYYEDPQGRNHFRTGPMDRPSVYFGGHANGKELDCGLSWDRVWKAENVPTFTDIDTWCHAGKLERIFTIHNGTVVNGLGDVVAEAQTDSQLREKFFPNFAFRPFWRTTNSFEEKDKRWHTIKPGQPLNVYFFPGEDIVMNLRVIGNRSVRLDIRAVGDSERHFHTTFEHEGFGPGEAMSFKRVNALDQFIIDPTTGKRKGNEGKTVVPTDTRVLDAGWKKVELLGRDLEPLGPLAGDAAHQEVGKDLFEIFSQIFKVSGQTEDGGEVLSIVPRGVG